MAPAVKRTVERLGLVLAGELVALEAAWPGWWRVPARELDAERWVPVLRTDQLLSQVARGVGLAFPRPRRPLAPRIRATALEEVARRCDAGGLAMVAAELRLVLEAR